MTNLVIKSNHSVESEADSSASAFKARVCGILGTTYKWLAPALVTWGMSYLLGSENGPLTAVHLNHIYFFMENDKDERDYQDFTL